VTAATAPPFTKPIWNCSYIFKIAFKGEGATVSGHIWFTASWSHAKRA